jgi:hypothetical protein
MKNITKLLAVLFLTMILGQSAATVMAYEVAYLRITGTLLPIEEENQGGLHDTLNVNITGKMRIFRIVKVTNLKANGYGRAALRHVVPARMNFVGSEDLIHNLQKSEIVGKPVTITGFLYPASRVLFVTAVDGLEKAQTN